MGIWNGKIGKVSLPTPFAVGDVNVYVVKGDALTLIDAGTRTEVSREALEKGLEELGLAMSDIEQVVLTHHHPDHASGIDFFPETVRLLGHRNNQRWLKLDADFTQQYTEFFTSLAAEFGVPDEMIGKMNNFREPEAYSTKRTLQAFLQEGDTIPGLLGWKVIETPGHAQSHLSFYHEKDGVMIGGDQLLAKISPNPLIEPPFKREETRPKSLIQYNDSLEKWLSIPISLTFTGHGEEVDKTHDLIQYRMERQHERAMQVKKMIDDKPSSVFEICKQLFPKVYQRELSFTLSETVGQLDYLENVGEIQKEYEFETILYKSK
jgi:glyoxylase-like metal-dependent hydrolase (beta-lactamase superfamily II)